jgi:hypothetical protein
MNRHYGWIGACLGALTLSGCFWLPVAPGPTFSYETRYSPPFSTDAPNEAPVRVTVEDRRPEWERTYRAMVESPAGWRKAVGLVPVENLRPSPVDSLGHLVETQLPTEAGETVVVRVDSFRVVLNDTERRHQEREEQLDEAAERAAAAQSGKFHFGFFITNGGVGPGFGSGFGGGVDRRLGGGNPPPREDRAVEPLFMRDYQLVKFERAYFGPPAELPKSYAPGVTCEIAAHVLVLRGHAPQRAFDVVVTHSVDFTSRDGMADVPRVVEGALEMFATRLRGDVELKTPPEPEL